MSHYKEYQMGLIDEDEFRQACMEEFAGEAEEQEETVKESLKEIRT